jgi:hypothetical protein
MKLRKMADGNYLLIKLNLRDRKYLEGFRKFEGMRTLRNTDKYLSQMLAVHIKAVFVMQTALMLEQEGTVSSVMISKVFDDLDKSISNFEKTIDKHFIKFSCIFDRRKKKKTKKRKSRKTAGK